jgi:hypothetical protein
LVLVVPVEEQTLAGDQAGGGGVEPEQVAPLVEEVPELAHAEEVGPAEATPSATQPEPAQQSGAESAEKERGPHRGCASPRPERGRGHGATIKLKKVISRKKARKQARTIVVTMPKEEAEMVDLGARPKKRERPKKTPNVDPPDPHKGSVLDPKKGVCADPVDGDAILGRGGPDPHSRDRERQLTPDKGGGKT